MAKPAVFACLELQEERARGHPTPARAPPWPFSYLRFSKQEMQVPRACSWSELLFLGLRGSWGCRRSSQLWPMCSSAWFEGLKGWNICWGRCQNISELCRWEAEPNSNAQCLPERWALSQPLCQEQHRCPVLEMPSQTHKSIVLGIYMHTYTRTHSFQLRVTRAFLCVCKLTTLVCRHGKKGCLFSMNMDPFLFCEHVRSKKKKILLTVWRWSSC